MQLKKKGEERYILWFEKMKPVEKDVTGLKKKKKKYIYI